MKLTKQKIIYGFSYSLNKSIVVIAIFFSYLIYQMSIELSNLSNTVNKVQEVLKVNQENVIMVTETGQVFNARKTSFDNERLKEVIGRTFLDIFVSVGQITNGNINEVESYKDILKNTNLLERFYENYILLKGSENSDFEDIRLKYETTAKETFDYYLKQVFNNYNTNLLPFNIDSIGIKVISFSQNNVGLFKLKIEYLSNQRIYKNTTKGGQAIFETVNAKEIYKVVAYTDIHKSTYQNPFGLKIISFGKL